MSIFNIFRRTQTDEKPEEEFYLQTQTTLPTNFAQMVMQLEMQLEFVDTYNLEVIQQLNQLYRMAIQYYINVDTKKANHFKSKLTSLLTHPNTLQIIEKKPEQAKGLEKQAAYYNKNLKQQLGKFNSQSQVVVRSIMQGSQRKLEKHSRLIDQNLNSQQRRLQRRLQERSRSKSRTKL